jgi:hypothetical protein
MNDDGSERCGGECRQDADEDPRRASSPWLTILGRALSDRLPGHSHELQSSALIGTKQPFWTDRGDAATLHV